MRAYLTIIRDAFHAAIAAKLLYVMLAVIALFLLALLPLGYTETLSYYVRIDEIRDPVGIARRLVQAGAESEKETQGPLRSLWSSLSDRQRERLQETVTAIDSGSDSGVMRLSRIDELRDRLHEAINAVVKGESFIESVPLDAWGLDQEGAEIAEIQPASRNADQTRRLHRLALEALFPVELARSGQTMLRFSYLGWVPFEDLGVSRSQLRSVTTELIPSILDKFVLSLGVLISILFTANMVPEMLEPGSLNLLLSKPIRRSGLFLSKFVGACAFTTLNATFLFTGLWMILGWRLQMWNAALLSCIPIYVFVFAIYYSVSAVVGLLLRSPILSIVASLLFWLFCFSIGWAERLSGATVTAAEPTKLVVTNERFVRFNRLQQAAAIPQSGGTWSTVLVDPTFEELPEFFRGLVPMPAMIGPIAEPNSERLIGARSGVAEPGAPFAGNRAIVTASPKSDWVLREHQALPPYVRELYPFDDSSAILVTHFGAVYRLSFDKLVEVSPAEAEPQSETETPQEEANDKPAADSPQTTSNPSAIDPAFEVISPRVPPVPPQAVAFDSSQRALVFYASGVLSVLRWDGERFEVDPAGRFQLPVDGPATFCSAAAGRIFVSVKKEWFVVDTQERTVRKQVWKGAEIRQVLVEPEGRGLAILDRSGDLWYLQSDGAIRSVLASDRGRLRALAAGDSKSFWVIDRYLSLQQIGWEPLKPIARGPSSMTLWSQLYRYGVYPLYWLTPKPGEFYRMVVALSESTVSKDDAGKSTAASEGRENSGENQPRTGRSPWQPFWNGLVFIVLMLGFGAWVFERSDF